jgi:lantibiotic biosynthesis protein
MNFIFSEKLLLRTPAKSWQHYVGTDRQKLLDDLFFRSALYLATPDFYEKLSRADFDYDRLSDREQLTLERYFNRISYRPTPFGLFSAITLISWREDTLIKVSDNNFRLTVQPDQTYVMMIGADLLSKELGAASLYRPNFTLYRTANEFRFIRSAIEFEKYKREYLLQSTAFSKPLKDLLAYCTNGRSSDDIIKFIISAWHCSVEEGEDYFEFLNDAHLLINTMSANITGQNYLQRLLEEITDKGVGNFRTRRLNEIFRLLYSPKVDPEFFKDVSRSMQSLLPEKSGSDNLSQNQFNVILRRDFQGTLDSKFRHRIKDGLFALDCLSSVESVPGLVEFAKAFEKHFEGQSLPLLAALDPETGVGYLERMPEGINPLLETVNIQHNTQPQNKINWTAAHSYLLDRWQKIRGDGRPVIQLDPMELSRLKKDTEGSPLQGISVLFRICKDQLYLESAGGINAPALMGRFTVVGTEIRDTAISMARAQEAANPGIIFAELLHLSDPHTDNVNSREKIWTWELPITATSTNDADCQLELSDLRVSIENKKVILRSAKHNKIVMPRLTSAYNHSINRLPLFRFLADISYQFGRTDLSLDLRQFFPGVSFYPEVTYQGTILHLATWILSETEIGSLQIGDTQEIIEAFERLSAFKQLPAMFSLAEGDQQLIFKRDVTRDRLFFAACIRQKKEAVIKEYLPDGLDNGFVNQFNAFVYSTEPIAVPACRSNPAAQLRQRRKFVPGSEWLYLKLYSPKISADKLLLRVLPLLRKNNKHGKIKRWFFIRYEDHAPHIRLRMQVSPDDTSELLIAFKNKLEDRINNQVIREYQVDTYTRELERYQTGNFEITENFFWASSEFVLSYLKRSQKYPALPPYLFALLTMNEMLTLFLSEEESKTAFVYKQYLQFASEFKAPKLHVELDKKYRQLSAPLQAAFKDRGMYANYGMGIVARRFTDAASMMGQSAREDDKEELLASMILYLLKHYKGLILHSIQAGW